ncbi:16S rRNA (guanine(966)-N(2))-methyltransferase RsmD [Mycoplasma sp. ATU-Cv-703]|uniref:16S rRNA (guanine(966)-N(2))-methyltransferase RsmD n=1 Tax=Mycoplasma sp. ATU-Cv-703 TaxID=2498595 RepID=UPI000FDEC4E4
MLRVIAGKYRGQRLRLPDQKTTRPMRDAVKEALFSIISEWLPGSVVLDAFAGSGSLAIEALSRGASKAIALEKDARAFQVLQENAEKIGVRNFDFYLRDALNYVSLVSGVRFDLIFLDPPYQKVDLLNEILKAIIKNNLLNSQGLIVVQTNELDLVNVPKQLVKWKVKRYQKTNLLFLTYNL